MESRPEKDILISSSSNKLVLKHMIITILTVMQLMMEERQHWSRNTIPFGFYSTISFGFHSNNLNVFIS